jgi:protein-L-isoaspartate(D-aspartate) O-methyltransferase
MNIELARTNMITQQLRTWDVLDEAVLQAVATIPREDFVPAAYRKLAFADMNIPLAHNQVMMTPREEARFLQTLDLQGTEAVLEIGTGSAYMTALLARMARLVYSIDIFPDFIQQAQVKLASHNINNVTLLTADASRGWEQQGPFDAIIITGALPFLPDSFRNSLKPGGRLIAILGQAPAMAATFIKRGEKTSAWSEEKLFETVTPVLINALQPPSFIF